MRHNISKLTSRIMNHWRERRQRSNRHYHEYLEFWRTYYIRSPGK